jgi:putative ABC transport system substrate-binding protein
VRQRGFLRRELLTLGLAVAAWPRLAHAQRDRLARVGVLASDTIAFFGPFRESLRAMGYAEGQSITYEIREARQSADLLPRLTGELVRLNVDVILAGATPAAQAAKAATAKIPIIAFSGDLLATGLVANLSRPGGNLTGLSGQSVEAQGKMLSLVRDLLPNAQRIAVLANEVDAFTPPFVAQIRAAAERLGMAVHVVMFRGGNPALPAIAGMVQERADAVIIQFSVASQEAIDAAISLRLPAFSNSAVTFAAGGGLMTIGGNREAAAVTLANYIDLILKGADAGDLPVQQPTKFDIAINTRTARTLGLSIPPSVLLQATHVFE